MVPKFCQWTPGVSQTCKDPPITSCLMTISSAPTVVAVLKINTNPIITTTKPRPILTNNLIKPASSTLLIYNSPVVFLHLLEEILHTSVRTVFRLLYSGAQPQHRAGLVQVFPWLLPS